MRQFVSIDVSAAKRFHLPGSYANELCMHTRRVCFCTLFDWGV